MSQSARKTRSAPRRSSRKSCINATRRESATGAAYPPRWSGVSATNGSMPRRGFTSTAVALLLAFAPATAFADGAGDQQYQDPLTVPSTPKKKTQAPSTAPASTTPAATTVPAATTAPASAGGTQTTAASSASSQELPRTGAPAALVGLAGATLIASGAALRRRTVSH